MSSQYTAFARAQPLHIPIYSIKHPNRINTSPRQTSISWHHIIKDKFDMIAEPTALVYKIDSEDRLTSFNDSWATFAQQNQAASLATPGILRRSLWDFIVDRETRLIYEMIFATVRKSPSPIVFPYRCDTPTCRRFMQMEIYPLEDAQIQLISRVLREEQRPYTPLLAPETQRSTEFLTICSWCKHVELPHARWAEVEEAISALGLFNAPILPQLTHGICPTCLESFRGWRHKS